MINKQYLDHVFTKVTPSLYIPAHLSGMGVVSPVNCIKSLINVSSWVAQLVKTELP